MKFLSKGTYLERDYEYTGSRGSCKTGGINPIFSLDRNTQYVEWRDDSLSNFKKALRQGPLSLAVGASDDF